MTGGIRNRSSTTNHNAWQPAGEHHPARCTILTTAAKTATISVVSISHQIMGGISPAACRVPTG